MQIETYRHNGMLRGVAIYDPPNYDLRRLDEPGDVIERLTGDRPWEAEDGTLSVELDSPQEAKAVAAYLRAYYDWFVPTPA